jgi:hypothetical protein
MFLSDCYVLHPDRERKKKAVIGRLASLWSISIRLVLGDVEFFNLPGNDGSQNICQDQCSFRDFQIAAGGGGREPHDPRWGKPKQTRARVESVVRRYEGRR